MKNIIEICKDFGFEVPADKQADFLKAVSAEYKTIAEHKKATDKLSGDLQSMTTRAETAESALKEFDGIDPANLKTQLEEANKKVKEAQEAAQKQIDERDFNDSLKTELDSLKFTSASARKAVEAEIRGAGLKLKNGKILGLSDLLDQIKKDDASAFVDEQQQEREATKPRFTQPTSKGGNGGGAMTKDDIMKITDRTERRAAMAQNFHLFTSKGE